VRSTPTPDPTAPPGGRLRLTSEGLLWLGVAFVLGAVGWYKSLNLVLLLGYLMLGLLVLNGARAWAHVRRVTATRLPLPPVFAGETANVRVTVRNTGRRPATVGVSARAGESAVRWLLYRLPGGAEVVCDERMTFPHRGLFRGSPLVVGSGFPFGLLGHERPADAGADVVVLPAPGRADADGLRRWLLRQAGGEGRSRKVLRRVTSDQADVRGVRPYRPGDSLRTVHWRSSARRGELMVREYDAAPSPDLVLVVEPWLPADPADADRANLEAALSLAATVALAWSVDLGTRVTVVVAGDETPARTGAPTGEVVRESLAPLAGAVGGPDFAAPGPEAFGRAIGQTARVLVSSRPDSPFAAALTRSTGRPFAAVSPTDRPAWYQPPTV